MAQRLDPPSRDRSVLRVPFPIPYQGSKRKLASRILSCFPGEFGILYEPFCGSAAVTMAALVTGQARVARINDSNEPLMRLWDAILTRPDELSAAYRRLWEDQRGRERAFYDEVRQKFNQAHEPHHFLFLLARCVKAAIRYNSHGDFNQSPDNRRMGARPDRMAEQIQRASVLMQGQVQMSSLNYRQALADVTGDDLVYMDPPYQGLSSNRDRRYRDVLALDPFVEVLDDLNRRSVSFIVSYDGRTGTRAHGRPLPETLHLAHFEVDAGRSTQATLLGQAHRTVESLYLSPALLARLGAHF
jgi:DNA adenine methylase